MARTWAECLEGMVVGDVMWCRLGRYRTKLLLFAYDQQEDHEVELKERLRLWKDGDIKTLHERVELGWRGLCGEEDDSEGNPQEDTKPQNGERLGKAAKTKTRNSAYSKAIKTSPNKLHGFTCLSSLSRATE